MKRVFSNDINCLAIKKNLLAMMQSSFGRLITLLLFLLILRAINHAWWPVHLQTNIIWWPVVMSVLCLTTFLPRYRRYIISVAGVVGWFYLPWFHWPTSTAMSMAHHSGLILAGWLVCLMYWLVVRAAQQRGRLQSPVALMITLIALLMAYASYALQGNARLLCWQFIAVLCGFCWYLAYNFSQLNTRSLGQGLAQASRFLPFWGGTPTPFAKGSAYLDAIEAKDATQLAASQLGGLHLLFLALAWSWVLHGLLAYQTYAELPSFAVALAHCAAGHPYAAVIAWQVMIYHFLYQLFYYAMNGHMIIAVCRMSGFAAARNTDKPFFASSIADFWNRYYFYFKELLVELFFYPTYFRCFKRWPQWRTAFATFMAAGVGNVIYHFFALPAVPYRFGLWQAIKMMQVYYFYALILSLAIAISQWRVHRYGQLTTTGWRRYLLRPFCVVGFYCIISVFSATYHSTHLSTNFAFVASLIGY
jgi:hypothetical protein